MNSAQKAEGGIAAIGLVEESVHLLRRTPVGALTVYYAGTAPFALGLVFFWARTTWFRPSDTAVAWAALGLVVLFALMKTAHAEFCARLLALRVGDVPPAPSVSRISRIAVAQLRLQTWGILLLPIALVLAVPFGWTYAHFQSASVIGEGGSPGKEAAAQAKLWPGQNHLGLLLLSALAMAVWVNVAVAFLTVPWLANRLLGIENLFGFTGWWFANTTFVASTLVLTWLAIDPLVKAFYVLRVFYGRSQRSGEDLRVELRTTRMSRQGWRAATTMLVLAAFVWTACSGVAQPEPGPAAAESSTAVQPADLDAAIDHVLAGSEFAWRLRPVPGADAAEEEEEGMLRQFLRFAGEELRDFFRWLEKLWDDLSRWVDRLFPSGEREKDTGPARGAGSTAARILLWAAVVLVAGLLIGIVVLAWRRNRMHRQIEELARPEVVAAPDLRDERTQAAQLPADGWLALAHEQLAAGEWRLALRAVYLATLAQLAADGFVSLAKFKTNMDYERELRRRALARQELVPWFATRRGTFEEVWYGRTPAAEAAVREWLAELERPQSS